MLVEVSPPFPHKSVTREAVYLSVVRNREQVRQTIERVPSVFSANKKYCVSLCGVELAIGKTTPHVHLVPLYVCVITDPEHFSPLGCTLVASQWIFLKFFYSIIMDNLTRVI